MSHSITLTLESYTLKVTHSFEQMKTKMDPTSILWEIQECINVLKELSIKIRRQSNKILNPFELLSGSQIIQIFEFFSRRETYKIGPLTCSLWTKILRPQNFTIYRTGPIKGMEYLQSLQFNFCIHNMIFLPQTSKLFLSSRDQCAFFTWDVDRKILQSGFMSSPLPFYHIAANNKYICAVDSKRNKILQYLLDYTTLVRKWEVSQTVTGINLDNFYVYVTTRGHLYIYNLEQNIQVDNLFCFWTLPMNPETSSRKLTIYKKEIYIVDRAQKSILVYSKSGQILRRWGDLGGSNYNFRDPWDIAISNDIIYVTDYHHIRAFNLDGKCLFYPFYLKNYLNSDLGSICILNNELYVSDWAKKTVERFALF